uniref:Uncharacterized protein n=2 Tax=Meloidogyne TaxID=189290 RepID=A0A6V7X946_MELEN|nr:unnamed protein product [Meloidogyne enterolobii]CAD2198205.1 unnamed protein product [Meloidogyne enterolobii]
MENKNDSENCTTKLLMSQQPKTNTKGPLLHGGCLSAGFWTGGTAASWRNSAGSTSAISPARQVENSPSPQLALPSEDSSNASSTSAHSSPLASPHPSTDQSLQTTSEFSGDRSERAGGSLPVGQITNFFPSPISSKSVKSNGLPSTTSEAAILFNEGDKNLHAFLKAIDQHKLAQPVSDQDKQKILTWLKDGETAMVDTTVELLPHPLTNEVKFNFIKLQFLSV